MKKKNSTPNFLILITWAFILLSNSCSNNETPLPDPIPEYYNAIAAGNYHSLALEPDGTLWTWGIGDSGQLGAGINSILTLEAKLWQIGTGYSAIAGGRFHSLALKEDGTLWAWGSNEFGQLGDSTFAHKNIPVQIGSGYSEIAAGEYHSAAIKTDGTLWVWGDNNYGQLGDGTNERKNTPVMIGSKYLKIAAGTAHTLAIKTDSTLWAWGNNNFGQLGDGTNETKLTPQQIGSGYAEIAADFVHTLALKTDGTLWAWGWGWWGQLGIGTSYENSNKNYPVKIGTSYKAIATGGSHSLAIKKDGSLWSWGDNSGGQLGDGTSTFKPSPVRIGSGYMAIAAGESNSKALKTDGTLWTWGWGSRGQLGPGISYGGTFITTPAQIGGN